MKKTIKNAAIGLFTLLAVTTGFTASAGDTTTGGAELKIAGQLNNQPVFQLNLNNTANQRFIIIVKDEYGTVLHEEIVYGTNITRKFQFNKELEGIDVRFEIRDVKGSKTEVFNVKNSSKVVSESAIVKS
ncbi:MAG: hypothetical protein IPK31_01325 [Chitinophagaceae bacterium]|nr:hypothetical protein [Chitinophagaceae bacterium]